MKWIKEHDAFDSGIDALSVVAIDLINSKQYIHLQNYLLLIDKLIGSKHHAAKSSLVHAFVPALFEFLETCKWKQEVIHLFPANLSMMYCDYVSKNVPLIHNDFKEFIIHLN